MILINGVLSLARPPAVAGPPPAPPFDVINLFFSNCFDVIRLAECSPNGESDGGAVGGGGATTELNGKGQGHVIKTNGYGAEF